MPDNHFSAARQSSVTVMERTTHAINSQTPVKRRAGAGTISTQKVPVSATDSSSWTGQLEQNTIRLDWQFHCV
jgi:hypothetical protein